jgi:hypothetical protein
MAQLHLGYDNPTEHDEVIAKHIKESKAKTTIIKLHHRPHEDQWVAFDPG